MRRFHFQFVLLMAGIITGIMFILPPRVAAGGSAGTEWFKDIRNHWARSHILRLAALDLVRGYPDATYRPQRPLTRLELVALVMRVGDFEKAAAEAARRGTRRRTVEDSGTPTSAGSPIPRVPWGQDSFTFAVKKEFLPPEWVASFNPDKPVTRAEVAALLARSFYLPVPEEGSTSGSAPSTGDFPDIDRAPALYQPYIRAVAAAGIMSGYSDGTFRPAHILNRAEMAVILSSLLDRNWVKVPAGRQLEGWVSSVRMDPKGLELELTSLVGVQKLRVSPDYHCFAGGRECTLLQAGNHRVEVILDGRRQVRWVNLLEERKIAGNTEKITGSVKSVVLGEDNLLVLNDLNCEDRIFSLAWDAVLMGKRAKQDFRSLKPGDFVEVELDGGQVKRVTLLEVKKISGTVGTLTGKTLGLLGRSGQKGNPDRFDYWDRARIVDREDRRAGGVMRGDRVEITYLDPIPGEIQDERVLQIKITSRPGLKKQTGKLQAIKTTGGTYRIVLEKDKEYEVDPAVRVTDPSGNRIAFSDLDRYIKSLIELWLDGAGVVMEIRIAGE
jgi:hypothetical protein